MSIESNTTIILMGHLFQTLTRMQGTFEMTGRAVGSILQSFNWNRVGILASKHVDIIWLHTRRGLHYAFERMNISIALSTLMEGEEGLEHYLVETAKVSRGQWNYIYYM